MVRLRGTPQVIVTLLLVVAIPEPSEGLFCYECKTDKDAPATEQCFHLQLVDKFMKECSEKDGYCHHSGLTDLQSRGCFSKIKGDCLKKYISGTCYDPTHDPKNEIPEKVKACTEAAGEQWEALPKGEVCLCSGWLSNVGALGSSDTPPCPKVEGTDKARLGPVAGTGEQESISNATNPSSCIMCYKCEGGRDSDCGKDRNDKLEKVNCPDWRFGNTIRKAGCFQSRTGGKDRIHVKGCGFQHQQYCRYKSFEKNCTLTPPEVVEYKKKDKDELEAKKIEVESCEVEADKKRINLRRWYNKQPNNTGSKFGRVVGHLGILQREIEEGKVEPAYRDCVCVDNLCNGPAGRSTSNWGVIIMAIVLVAAVLSG